jgi:hypothetical protein
MVYTLLYTCATIVNMPRKTSENTSDCQMNVCVSQLRKMFELRAGEIKKGTINGTDLPLWNV